MPAFADIPAPGSGLSAVGEARLVPVESTRVALPWCPGHQLAIAEFRAPGHDGPWECCPRSALRNTLRLLLDNFGLELKVGFEVEFLLLERAEPGHEATREGGSLDRSGWRPVDRSLYSQSSALDRHAEVLDEMVGSLEAMGIGVVQWHAESAPGQFEIALQYGDALTAADQLLLAKEAIVGVAGRRDLAVSFLPKPRAGAAGNGCHAHFSLWKDGKPHMAVPSPTGTSFSAAGDSIIAAATLATAAYTYTSGQSSSFSSSFSGPHPPIVDPHHVPAAASSAAADQGGFGPRLVPAPAMLCFLAGVLAAMEVLLPFTAPCPNSYERLQPGGWAGAHVAWGYNNREAPLRVTAPGPGRLGDMHIEFKAIDGSANPYIALSAITVAGMLGIFANLSPPEPCQVPPDELQPEAAARLGVKPLPGSLAEALARIRKAEPFRAAMAEAIGAPLLQAHLAVRAAEADHAERDTPADLLLRYS
ncbi:hypothetical protein GPECTOR_63g67 [Gonium pectorale]|uniref:GS catalytic domain-containing protein n=1 Tax=Gonium pectorale TaxID=33097 RepID=A0A150G4F1_GONPE|nr:hypothetical protein GPECTOR_63g67 [Gonium pectorale]|eukprot:KXZ44742.1 hypothetical protein GPECTOR_63g67 [Gonium pectorale]